MFYKLTYDMENLDDLIAKGANYIYAEDDNLDLIETDGFEKGRFHTLPIKDCIVKDWPEVIFYFSSSASNKKSDYLLNNNGWPIVSKQVKDKLEENNVQGVLFYPIILQDVVTDNQIEDYYFMYITRFVDCYDMDKSEYRYNTKYDVYTFIPMKTYLNADVCKDEDVFRALKSPSNIYVSEKVYSIIKENQFTAFSLKMQL